MSPTTHSLVARLFTVAGVLAAASIVPATAGAQTGAPERALLNYSVAIPMIDRPHVASDPSPARYRVEWDQGERALLGRGSVRLGPVPHEEATSETSWFNALPVNGELALLGKSTEQ